MTAWSRQVKVWHVLVLVSVVAICALIAVMAALPVAEARCAATPSTISPDADQFPALVYDEWRTDFRVSTMGFVCSYSSADGQLPPRTLEIGWPPYDGLP